MDVARALLPTASGIAEPSVLVVADEQTAGRGRQGRVWVAPAGSALLFSLGLRPRWPPAARSVTLLWMVAVALCEALERYNLAPRLKWPNDLLLPVAGLEGGLYPGYAKVAGILLELRVSGQMIERAILGCGVNISAAPPADQTRYPASSLYAAGATVDRQDLLVAIVERIDTWYGRASGAEAQLFAGWRSRLIGLGQPIQVQTIDGPVAGVAEDVDSHGALLIRRPDGTLLQISGGDVGLI